MPEAVIAAVAAVSTAAAEAGSLLAATSMGSLSVGTGLFSSVSLGSLTSSLASVGVSYALNRMLTPHSTSPAQPGQVVTNQAVSARMRHYGRVQVGGTIVFRQSKGVYLWQVQAHAQGPIDAYENFVLGTYGVTIDGSGAVTNTYDMNPAATPVYNSLYNAWVKIKAYTGTKVQASDPDLQSDFTYWTSAHRLTGIAYCAIRFTAPPSQYFRSVFASGAPTLRVRLRGARVYDPRYGTQNPDDDCDAPATWSWSSNGPMCVLDFLRHPDGYWKSQPSSRAMAPLDLFDLASFVKAANDCDQVVPSKSGGDRKLFETHVSYSLQEDSATVLRRMLATFDGEIYQNADGKIGIRAGVPQSTTVALDGNHIIGIANLAMGTDETQKADQVKAFFTDPRQDYQQVEAPTWYAPDRKTSWSETVDLQGVQSAHSAQRLAKRFWYLTNPLWSCTLTTTLAGLKLIGESRVYIDLTAEINVVGYWRITSWRLNADGATCTIGVVFWPPESDAWDVGSEERDQPPIPPPTGIATVGYVPVSTPAMVASGGSETNTNYRVVTVYISGGSAVTVFVNGVNTGAAGGTFVLNPSDTIALTYSSAPSWTWS